MASRPGSLGVIVTSDHELRKIAGEIAWYEEESRKGVTLLLQYRLEIGKRLARAKSILPHGEFLSWAQYEFGWTPRHVQNHLTLAANASLISRLDAGASLNMALAAIKKTESRKSEGTNRALPVGQHIHLIGEIEEGQLDCEGFLTEIARLATSYGASRAKWKIRAALCTAGMKDAGKDLPTRAEGSKREPQPRRFVTRKMARVVSRASV
jgi:hypothetical protein